MKIIFWASDAHSLRWFVISFKITSAYCRLKIWHRAHYDYGCLQGNKIVTYTVIFSTELKISEVLLLLDSKKNKLNQFETPKTNQLMWKPRKFSTINHCVHDSPITLKERIIIMDSRPYFQPSTFSWTKTKFLRSPFKLFASVFKGFFIVN